MPYPTPTPLFDKLKTLEQQKLTVHLKHSFASKDFRAAKLFLLQYKGNQETFRAYRREIDKLLQWAWLIAKKSILKLTRDDIEDFIKFCQHPPNSWINIKKVPKFLTRQGERVPNPRWRPFVVSLSKAKRKKGEEPTKDNYMLSQKALQALFDILNSFYTHLIDEDICNKNPVKQIKQKKSKYLVSKQGKREIRRLSDEQWQSVLEAAKELAKSDEKRHERTLFVISSLYLMYLRISELIITDRWHPQMGNFHQDSYGNWWFKTIGKGNKERNVAVNNSMLEALKRYRKHRQLSPLPYPGEDSPLIYKLRGDGNITDAMQIRDMVQQCFDLAISKLYAKNLEEEADTLQKATVHWLRHTGISDDINKYERPIAHVRDDAGHSSIAVTDLYNDIELKKRHASAERRSLIEQQPKKARSDAYSPSAIVLTPETLDQNKGKNSIALKLWLRVENNSKFVRGKGKVRREIEEYLAHYYNMVKVSPDRWDYEITIYYTTEQDLEDTIYNDIYSEMQSIADMRNCFIEADIYTFDGEKSW